jgi:aldehyde dehydrogenase (NAD+)
MRFEPDAIRVPCGHFISGRLAPAADALTVHRPSGARPHAGLPVADAATVDTTVLLIDFGAAPSAEAVSAWAAFHAVAGRANESFGAAGAANRHKLARRAC